MEERLREDRMRRQLSTRQGERPQKKPPSDTLILVLCWLFLLKGIVLNNEYNEKVTLQECFMPVKSKEWFIFKDFWSFCGNDSVEMSSVHEDAG